MRCNAAQNEGKFSVTVGSMRRRRGEEWKRAQLRGEGGQAATEVVQTFELIIKGPPEQIGSQTGLMRCTVFYTGSIIRVKTK